MFTFVSMKVIKKYSAIQLGSRTINDDVEQYFHLVK